MKSLFEPEMPLTDCSLQLEEITEAQPLKPLEVVEPVRVELVWPGVPPRPRRSPARPVPGQLWMGTPRIPKRLRHRSRHRRARWVRLLRGLLSILG